MKMQMIRAFASDLASEESIEPNQMLSKQPYSLRFLVHSLQTYDFTQDLIQAPLLFLTKSCNSYILPSDVRDWV